jgi:hypothetical protein
MRKAFTFEWMGRDNWQASHGTAVQSSLFKDKTLLLKGKEALKQARI